jgi:hypothetical protein
VTIALTLLMLLAIVALFIAMFDWLSNLRGEK